MPFDEHGVGVRVFVHCLFETSSEVLFERRVLYNGYPQCVMKAHHSSFGSTTRNTFDLLNVADLETGVLTMDFLNKKGDKDCPLAVSMN